MRAAIAAVAAVFCARTTRAQVRLDTVDRAVLQRSLDGMAHFRSSPVVRDVFAKDVQCYDLVFGKNAGRSMYGWVELANQKLMEDDWSCALTIMVQVHRFSRLARDAARGDDGSSTTEAAWHYVNASFSLAVLYTFPSVVTILSDEAFVHVARGEKLLRHVLEVVAADGLVDTDSESVRYMVEVAEKVFAEVEKARAEGHTPVSEAHAASYVERPAYWGEADELVDCGDAKATARLGMLYALFGDHQLAGNLLLVACEGCQSIDGGSPSDADPDACALRDLVALRGAQATRWVDDRGGPTPWEPRPSPKESDATWALGPNAGATRDLYVFEEDGLKTVGNCKWNRGWLEDACRADDASCAAGARPPTTGVFLLRSLAARRPYVDKHPALALTLRAAVRTDGGLADTARLHVLVHEGDVAATRDAWAAHLGREASHLLGGVHLTRFGLTPRRPSDLNYLRKIFTAVVISRRRRYDTIVSLDDDILLAPPAYLALLQHAPGGVRGPDSPCAMVTPTVSTGIPTAELFAADFLSEDAAATLERCYLETIRRSPQRIGDPDFSLAGTLERLEGPWPSASSWDPAWWRERLWDKAADFLYDNVRSYGLGLHPVRVNETCTELAFLATLPLIPDHFGASATSDRLALAKARLDVGGPRAYPYLANSVWATSPARLAEVLLRVDLATNSHPFDEAGMSTLFLHERNERLCVLRNAFAVHPHYGGASFVNRSDFEARLHAAAYGALLLRDSVGDAWVG